MTGNSVLQPQSTPAAPLFVESADGLHHVDFGRNVVCLLGLPFDVVDLRQATDRVIEAAAQGRRLFLTTPNVNFAMAARHDAAFRASVIASDLSVADGMPLIWIARLIGLPLRQRVAGSDLFERLMHRTGSPLKVYFFGGPDGVAQQASLAVNVSPGLQGAGGETPGFGDVEAMSSDLTIERINRSGADFLLVALGAKKGQAWIVRNLPRLTVPVVSHLGAVVNFVAGSITRAPVWWRRLGLEWLWRIRSEPGLWRRYASDALGLAQWMLTRVLPCFCHRHLQRWLHAPKAAELRADESPTAVSMVLAGDWLEDISAFRRACARYANDPRALEVDLRNIRHVDAPFIASCMLLDDYRKRIGIPLAFRVGRSARAAFRHAGADYLVASPA